MATSPRRGGGVRDEQAGGAGLANERPRRLAYLCERSGLVIEGGAVERYELEAWLGPALKDLSPEQVDHIHQEAEELEARYPDPDEADDREAALVEVVQRLLGEYW